MEPSPNIELSKLKELIKSVQELQGRRIQEMLAWRTVLLKKITTEELTFLKSTMGKTKNHQKILHKFWSEKCDSYLKSVFFIDLRLAGLLQKKKELEKREKSDKT